MTNPTGEVDNTAIEPSQGMTEDEILKRLEPKYPEDE
jgi:hypothetical protein